MSLITYSPHVEIKIIYYHEIFIRKNIQIILYIEVWEEKNKVEKIECEINNWVWKKNNGDPNPLKQNGHIVRSQRENSSRE